MNCELCGKEDNLIRVEIEGTTMNVCRACSNLGKRKAKVDRVQKNTAITNKEPLRIIVANYNVLIKRARENKNLKHDELAKKLAEKESTIQQVESKKLEPSFKLAKKLEKELSIKLIETYTSEFESTKKEDTTLTLADTVVIKRRTRK
ncbi:MAG: helix-turn-helix domain-containing protein [Candidatus Woesearchaeota archaeon]